MCGRFVLCSGLLCLASSLKLSPAEFWLKQGRMLSLQFKFFTKSGH